MLWRERKSPFMRTAKSPSKSPSMSSSMSPSFLSHAELDTVIRLAPLVAIDLIIRNRRDEVLLGLRKNEPAKGCYFVPGGMILKNERLADAFARLVKNETGQDASLDDARLLGVFEHFYDNNRSGRSGYGTHYIVLGYEFSWPSAAAPTPDDQHSELRWWPMPELLASDRVHDNAKAYFRR
jgi:colanic acid biosynthesis protein WcaH